MFKVLKPHRLSTRNGRRILFQQDRAPQRFTLFSLMPATHCFLGRLINTNCNVFWRPKSLDVNFLDYWLWSVCMFKFFRQTPETLNEIMYVVETKRQMRSASDIRTANNNLRAKASRCCMPLENNSNTLDIQFFTILYFVSSFYIRLFGYS